jgi:hypothetical protein
MISPRRVGFSLLEAMIGVGLLASLAILFLHGVSAGRKQAEFTGDYFNGFFLAQKVTEDLASENVVNPSAFATLGLEGSPGSEGPVTEGQSVFFSHLFNRREPFDRVEPTRD